MGTEKPATLQNADAADHSGVMRDTAINQLFQPLQVAKLHLSNRIVMSPMTRGFSPDGIPGEDVATYYGRRAAGGVGLIITEGVGIDDPAALGDAGLNEANIPVLHGTAALEGWRRVVEEVHAAGGKIMPQLWHMGVMKMDGTGPFPDAPARRPSGLWGPKHGMQSIDPQYVEQVHAETAPMTERDIEEVIAAYVRSARNAKAVGFDGIAIHAAHGYLIDTFLWDETNKRQDRFGGDIARRSCFAVEVVKAIRAEIGAELPISFRFSQWKQQDFKARLAHTPQQLEQILGPIADAGVDVFEASTRYFDVPEFEGSPLNLAGWAKKVSGKLSMTVGGIGLSTNKGKVFLGKDIDADNDMSSLLTRFERDEFDLVQVGRSLLHDADWSRKLKSGQPFLPFERASLKTMT